MLQASPAKLQKMRIRKFLTATLIVIITASTFAGCNKEDTTVATEPVDVEESVNLELREPTKTTINGVKTIGDVIALDRENSISSVSSTHVVYAFKLEDNYYRVVAPISKELAEKYSNVDYLDDDFNEKQDAIIAPLKIERIELLNNQMLTEEELTSLTDKTGEALVKAGWTFQDTHDLDKMEFWMDYGPFEYLVVFNGKISESQYEVFNESEDLANMTVKSVQFESLGDATSLN